MLEAIALGSFAFLMAFVNGALGGGYGTITGPVLLLWGYSPQSFIPAILFSEVVSEYWSGTWHVKFHNVNARAFLLTTAGSAIGIITAILLIGTIFSPIVTKIYIGVIAVLMGALVVLKSFGRYPRSSTGKKDRPLMIVLLGIVCGFNKSGSGGGYGPISTSGYMLLGFPTAVAVGTTIMSKATGCLLSVVFWAALRGIDWNLALPMSVGAFLGAPIAAWLNNYFKLNIKPLHHERLIGLIMLVLGVFSVLKQTGLF